MAGTINPGEEGMIHFLNVDGQGSVNAQKIFSFDSEHRVVSLLQYDPESYYIVALQRDNPGNVDERDRIRLLRVYANGTLVDNRTIESAVPSGSSDYTNMYPMHAIELNGLLYICGYITREWSTAPAYPDYTGDLNKKVFVLSYNPITNTLLNIVTLDGTFTPPPPLPPPNDFDIAMRLIPLPSGRIYVTGSCNIVRAEAPCSPPYQQSGVFASGTLNMIVDQSLNVVMPNKPIAELYGPETYGEYGLSIIPNPDQGVGGYFLMGNTFTTNSNAPGFNPVEPRLTLTYLDNNFDLPTGGGVKQRLTVANEDYSWGLHTLPSYSGPDNFLIAGMQTNSVCFDDEDPLKPSYDHYSPFLTEVTPSWDGVDLSGTAFNYWNIFLTQFGTGPMSQPNSYHRLGGGLSNNLWQPIFACRRTIGASVSNNIGISAPSWNDELRRLNFRFIYADRFANVPDCPESVRECTPDAFHNVEVFHPFYDGTPAACSSVVGAWQLLLNGQYLIAGHQVSLTQYPISEFGIELHEEIDCVASGGTFKKTNQALTSFEPNIFPNPANNHINLELDRTDIEFIEVSLSDQTGRVIANLFKVAYAAYTGQLSLPEVAPGLYLLTVRTDDQKPRQFKLIIQ